jgi:hypothetical protein
MLKWQLTCKENTMVNNKEHPFGKRVSGQLHGITGELSRLGALELQVKGQAWTYPF